MSTSSLEIPTPFGRPERLERPDQIPSWEAEWLGLQPPGRWSHLSEWATWKTAIAELMSQTRKQIWSTWETCHHNPSLQELLGQMPKGLDVPGIPAALPYLNEHQIFVIGTRMGPILMEAPPAVLVTYLEGPSALVQAHMVDLDGLHPLPPATLTLLGDSDPLTWRQARLWGWGALYHQRFYRLWTPDPCEASPNSTSHS
jgi:hypothetical protein